MREVGERNVTPVRIVFSCPDYCEGLSHPVTAMHMQSCTCTCSHAHAYAHAHAVCKPFAGYAWESEDRGLWSGPVHGPGSWPRWRWIWRLCLSGQHDRRDRDLQVGLCPSSHSTHIPTPDDDLHMSLHMSTNMMSTQKSAHLLCFLILAVQSTISALHRCHIYSSGGWHRRSWSTSAMTGGPTSSHLP